MRSTLPDTSFEVATPSSAGRRVLQAAFVLALACDAGRSFGWLHWQPPIPLVALGYGFDAAVEASPFALLALFAIPCALVRPLRPGLWLYAILSFAAAPGAIGAGLGLDVAELRDADALFSYGMWRLAMVVATIVFLVAVRDRARSPL